jgi:hypothetical protein
MIIGINPDKAPLRKYASPHLQQIKFHELESNLAARGVKIVNVGDSAIKVNLRGLLEANGTIQRAQVALMEILHELGADSCNIEPDDVEYISGRDVFQHAIARGLEAGVEPLQAILQDIPITEDGDGQDMVPIFSRLDKALDFVATDFHPNPEVQQLLKSGAEDDLFANSLLDRSNDYRGWMDVREEQVPELPRDFQTSPRPYRSIFDTDGAF